MEDVTKKVTEDKDQFEDDAEYILGYCNREFTLKMVSLKLILINFGEGIRNFHISGI